nr:MAG TPA: hypothetical protein [Caudoviricetes sp.]
MAPSCGGFSFPYRNRAKVSRKPCKSVPQTVSK